MAANEWPEKTRMIVTISIGLALNIGLGVVFYYAYSEYKEKDKILTAKKAEIAKLNAIIDQKQAKDATLKQLQTDFETKKEKLPDAAAMERLIDDFAAIADTDHCANKSWRPTVSNDAGSAGQNLLKRTIQTRWEADFWGWAKMLNEIEERFPRFIGFENMTLTPKNSGMEATGASHDIGADIITYQYIRQNN